ncbi:MAG: hypothetical protein AAB449_01685 [Patescibacteria group bacterium]
MGDKEKISERINTFEEIRDIPYHIGLTLEEEDCSCATKPTLLAKKLRTLGLESRRILCEFSWSALSIPQEVLHLAKKIQIHTNT